MVHLVYPRDIRIFRWHGIGYAYLRPTPLLRPLLAIMADGKERERRRQGGRVVPWRRDGAGAKLDIWSKVWSSSNTE